MDQLITRFLLPSIALQKWIPSASVVLDVGSGMGVPGIPLLIARPDLQGILVDRRMKRTEFLRHVVRQLGLDCRVYCCDVRDVEVGCCADVVVARAVANPAELLSISAPLVRKKGIAVLPTGLDVCQQDVDGWCAIEGGELQFGDDWRQRVLCYRRL